MFHFPDAETILFFMRCVSLFNFLCIMCAILWATYQEAKLRVELEELEEEEEEKKKQEMTLDLEYKLLEDDGDGDDKEK